jgi:SAM-dependent methyltransferase
VSRGNIRFEIQNVLELGYPDASFDAAIAERVLINLPEIDLQVAAVKEVARVLRRGGEWILVEVTRQGHNRIDAIRSQFELPPIEKYWHNLYLDEPEFDTALSASGFRVKEVHRFETYQFLTKVLHPLITAPAEPRFLAGFNRAAGIVARSFPDQRSVRELGLAEFLHSRFRPLVAEYDPERLSRFNAVAERIVSVDPDFAACSHQVMTVLELI